MNRLWCRAAVALACATAMSTSVLQAQETLQQVKTLYASAAYEDALTVLTRVQAVNRRPEFEQYRVFCLVALGRTAEAEKAIASVVSADPTFVPDAKETSPRIREMFDRTRRALVPEIAQRLYLEARASMDRKDKAAAVSQFEALVRVIDSTPNEQDEEPLLSELRLLAAGFLELTRASEVHPAPASPPARPQSPAAAQPLDITSPTPVKQDLPTWVPPDQTSQREFRGAIRVSISESGRVTDAALSPAIHPVYDRLLLQAAKSWQYQPALRNGSPVASEKVIEVVLKPR